MKINLEGQQQGQPINGPELQNAEPVPSDQSPDGQQPLYPKRPKYTYTRFWFIKKRVIQDRTLGGKKHVRYYVEWSKK